MFKWICPILCMLPLIAIAVWVIQAIVDLRRTTRNTIEQRARIRCPNCGCSLAAMFDEVDRIAMNQMREVIRKAEQQGIIVTPAGHPVEANCIGCNCRLSFGMSDIVRLVDETLKRESSGMAAEPREESVMSEQTPKIDPSKLLLDMYQDGYFPNFLVDKVRDSILQACREIEEQKPNNLEDLYAITCRATDRINDLAAEFEDNESELETGAREDIADSFGYVAEFYGFADADIEELIATRDW